MIGRLDTAHIRLIALRMRRLESKADVCLYCTETCLSGAVVVNIIFESINLAHFVQTPNGST